MTNDVELPRLKSFEKESVPGAYVQYTYNLEDKLILMGGIRGDYSSMHGFFVTPRAHVKYNPNEFVNFRLSAGKDIEPIMCWQKIIICLPAVEK